jgi:hypothetical protein
MFPAPRSLCPLSSTEFVEPPLQKKFLGTPLVLHIHFQNLTDIWHAENVCVDLYTKDARFIPWAGYQLFWLDVLVAFFLYFQEIYI